MIKFCDLAPSDNLRSKLDDAYNRVMSSGRYIGGLEVEAFEQEWAAYNEAKYCAGCASGLDAIMLVLLAKTKDRLSRFVKVPEWTAPATWSAVKASRLRPTMAFTGLEIVAHLYGLKSFVDDYDGIDIIQDCAQAHGLKLNQDNVCCWSFYPTKNLGSYGDGGAITTNDETLAGSFRQLAIPYSSRLDPIQAAFLRVKLKYLDGWNRQRQEFAQYYLENLQSVILPKAKWDEAIWHQFVIRTDKRDELKAYLADHNIETMIHYPAPPHRVLNYYYNLPEADNMAATVLSLPIAPHLTLGDIKRVTEKINGFFN